MSYTETVTKSYGSKIMDSLKWILIGLLMFLASFAVLWTNEWTVDMSKIAKTSTEVEADKVNTENNEKFISVTWEINSEEKIWDNLYLKNGDYIFVSRKVEMFAWKEKSTSSTDKNLWGSETTTTKYDYYKEWTEKPEKSINFKESQGHNNPEKKISSSDNKVLNAQVWEFNIKTSNLSLTAKTKLQLNEENTVIKNTWTGSAKLNNWIIYEWFWTSLNPQVWDIRISYTVLNKWENVTVMGKQKDKEIISYSDEDWNQLFRVFYGTRADAISTLKTEYLFKLWMFRALWFFLMFMWLSLVLAPIWVFLDIIPVAGSITKFITWAIAFVVALVLSIITILISMIFHNIIALILVVLLIIWWTIYFLKKKKTDISKMVSK